jgi:FtsP/CotA-like multicopper oxidase with cupredoxin domain
MPAMARASITPPLPTRLRGIVLRRGRSRTANAYMFHCHFSNHEDEGMMGQFKVVP